MKITVALTALAGATTVAADSIALGYLQYNGVIIQRAMWREGQDPCNWNNLGGARCPEEGGLGICTDASNPCEREFKLPANGKSYRLKNCGNSNFALHYFNSQTFISRGVYAPWSVRCNGDPNNQIIKEWQFQCDKPGC
ncbi:hypothetical protein V8F20_008525 [Naviculisporaceae sp. PSN 640]